jgi:predicted nicotinamide N-methyase
MTNEDGGKDRKQSFSRREFVRLSSVTAAAVGTGMVDVAAGSEGAVNVHTTDFSEWVQ